VSTAEASNRLKSFLATEAGATSRNSGWLRDMAIEVLGKNTRVKQRVPGGRDPAATRCLLWLPRPDGACILPKKQAVVIEGRLVQPPRRAAIAWAPCRLRYSIGKLSLAYFRSRGSCPFCASAWNSWMAS